AAKPQPRPGRWDLHDQGMTPRSAVADVARDAQTDRGPDHAHAVRPALALAAIDRGQTCPSMAAANNWRRRPATHREAAIDLRLRLHVPTTWIEPRLQPAMDLRDRRGSWYSEPG